MLKNQIIFFAAVIALTLLALRIPDASALDMTGSGYQVGEHRRVQYVQTGVVEAVRAVRINVEANYATRATGAAIGAALAGYAGSRRNNAAGFLLATLGGLAGDQIAKRVSEEARNSVEAVVTLDNGKTIVVVQEYDPEYPIFKGDRVRLIEGQEVRVAPIR